MLPVKVLKVLVCRVHEELMFYTKKKREQLIK